VTFSCHNADVIVFSSASSSILLSSISFEEQQQQQHLQDGAGQMNIPTLKQQSLLSSSRMFPAPVTFLRSNIPLEVAMVFPNRQFSGECSCQNPKAKLKCCARRYRIAYKMRLPRDEMDDFIRRQDGLARLVDYPLDYNYLDAVPWKDYRDVLVLRNIYDTLVGGYRAHFSQRECKRGIWRKQSKRLKSDDPDRLMWNPGYVLDPPRAGRSLCEYIASVPAEAGMRAYIDFAFRSQYVVTLSHWAMSRGLPEVRERTLAVCAEDFAATSATRSEAYKRIQDFMYNGTDHKQYYREKIPGVAGGFVASFARSEEEPDPDEDEKSQNRRHALDQVVRAVDAKYFNGDIAWLDSILPC